MSGADKEQVSERLALEKSRLFGTLVGSSSTGNSSHSALILESTKPAQWSYLAPFWSEINEGLGKNAVALAVNGADGLQLWIAIEADVSPSLAEEFALAFLQQQKSQVHDACLNVWLQGRNLRGSRPLPSLPIVERDVGRWSAFVTRDLVSLFDDEPWLDIAPQSEQQADILSKITRLSAGDLRKYLGARRASQVNMAADQQVSHSLPAGCSSAPTHPTRTEAFQESHRDPAEFLLHVMNSPEVEMRDRIEAAQALLQVHTARQQGLTRPPT
jgi:hypothetical protein